MTIDEHLEYWAKECEKVDTQDPTVSFVDKYRPYTILYRLITFRIEKELQKELLRTNKTEDDEPA